jgi:hypothetical protein
MREKHNFVTFFTDSAFDPKLTFFLLIMLFSIGVGISAFRTKGNGAVLIQDIFFEVHLHDQKIDVWCTITVI